MSATNGSFEPEPGISEEREPPHFDYPPPPGLQPPSSPIQFKVPDEFTEDEKQNIRRPKARIAFQDQDPSFLPSPPAEPGKYRRSTLYADMPRPRSGIDEERPPKKSLAQKYSPIAAMARRKVTSLGWQILILSIIAYLCGLIVFIAPGWGRTLEIRGFEFEYIDERVFEGEMYGEYGLWFACWNLKDSDTRTSCELIANLEYIPSWFKGCQAMGVLSMVMGLATLASAGSYVCAKTLNRNPINITATLFLSSGACVFSVIMFVLFCIQFMQEAYWCCPKGTMQIVEWNLSYCFMIGIIAPVCYLSISVCASMEINSLKQKEHMDKYLERVASTRKSGMDFMQGPVGYGPVPPYGQHMY